VIAHRFGWVEGAQELRPAEPELLRGEERIECVLPGRGDQRFRLPTMCCSREALKVSFVKSLCPLARESIGEPLSVASRTLRPRLSSSPKRLMPENWSTTS
jgi:hypothetical protein